MNEQLAKLIVESGITEIIFAIDGLSQETYEKYRRGGSFETVISNLKKVIEQKEKVNSDIEITVQFLVFNHNFMEIPRLGDFFNPMGVDNIYAKSVMMMTESPEKELVELARRYLYFDYPGERYKIVNDHFCIKGDSKPFCPLVDSSFVVTTDEYILPCCWDHMSEYTFNNYQGWEQVKALINSEEPPAMCSKCPIRYDHTFSWKWDEVPGVNYH
jgi:MoaA/NifB/PqqE/SkfB family radical SAM enzyme